MKPRLCIVNPYEHGGGAEYQISLLIDALAATDRYEIHYLAHFPDERERVRVRSYQVDRIGGSAGMPRLGYLMDAPSLYRKLRELDPCAIYQRVACAYTGICAYYAGRHAVPLLWHVAHDTDVAPFVLDPARNIFRARLEKSAIEYGARRATGIIVQTRHQAQLLRQYFGRTADAVIPNFHPPATEVIDKSGPLTVVWIANLKPWKRPEAFVRLAQALSDHRDVRFIMVGGAAANSENRRWQQALMQDIEGTKNLTYVGRKSHAEVNELLGRAHIFVNTSTLEGFPNTFIQSWLRDVAVVSLSVDPDRVLEEKQVGIAAHSEAALQAAVRSLIDSPELRAGYIRRAREHAASCHSLRNALDLIRLIDVFRARASR